MANRTLTESELTDLFSPLISEVRAKLNSLSAGDAELHWALRRKLAKTLTYDERNVPNHRRMLKAHERKAQRGLCATCACELPAKYTVLDRIEAMLGYTDSNTRLICRPCDERTQLERGYK